MLDKQAEAYAEPPKYLILGGEFMDDAFIYNLRLLFEEQYGIDFMDWENQHLMIAVSNDDGDMWDDLYESSPEWEEFRKGGNDEYRKRRNSPNN